jgi:hypothetical protein
MTNRRHAILLFLCVFAAGLTLFSRHNSFPFYYHPDEPGKVAQLIHHKRNFHHPMMMLSTVNVVRYVVLRGEDQKKPQKVVEAGRWSTAAVSAAAVAALAVLAFQLFGGLAGWAAGLLGVTNPLLFDLAHYFKEDPWMMAGIAFFCLALNAFTEAPTLKRLYFLAVTCAMAAAGKYVAFLLLPVALGFVWRRTEPLQRKQRFLRFLGTFAGVWLLFNLSFLTTPGLLVASLHGECTKLAGMTEGVTRNVPHDFYINAQSTYGGWAVPMIALLWLVSAVRTPRQITAAEWLLAVLAASQFVLYSFIPKTAIRYYLPISLALAILSIAGIARLLALARDRSFLKGCGVAVAAALIGTAVAFQVQCVRSLDAELRSDDRREVIVWIRSNLPAGAVLAADRAVQLPDLSRREHAGLTPLVQRLVGREKEVADVGTISELRAQGVTHVAICERTYMRYLDSNKTDKDGSNQTPERVFYETLLKNGRIVWSSESGNVYLRPGIKLVDISRL